MPGKDGAAKGAADIKALEDRRYAAMLAGDVETLRELSSERLVYTHSNAERDDRRSYLDKVASRHFHYLEISRPEETVSILGDTAIVVGRMVARVLIAGEEKRLDNRSLAVWARDGGHWAFLAYQPTPLPK